MILGIDPGITGALACVSDEWTGAISMPLIGKDTIHSNEIHEWLHHIISITHGHIKMACIEKSQVMPKQGIVSSGKYMKGYGQVYAIIALNGYLKGFSVEEIPARTWKVKMGLGGKGKEESIRRASMLFPHIDMKRKKDHGIAEALLIAEYGRRFLV